MGPHAPTSIGRRAVLSAAAAGAASAALGTAPAAAAPRRPRPARAPGRVRFGVRTPFPEKDLRRRALLLRELGYDGIELGPEYLQQPAEQIRAALAGTGIAVSAIVGSLKLLDPDPEVRKRAVALDRERLALARALGAAGLIEVPAFGTCKYPDLAGAPPPHAREDQLLVEGLRALRPDLDRTGVTLLLEPLTRKETHFMNLQSHGARVIEAAGGRGLALLSDYYHMQLEESDIGRTLAAFGAHTAYVHLADGERRTEPGSLPFDYRPGFRALKNHGFSGWLTVECKASDEPAAALARALGYVKAQWADA
jgi:sugar phosphate isomerase/epimerase